MSPGAPRQAGNLNIANVLTVLRLACVPLLIWLLVLGSQGSTGARDLAAAVFLGASLTDLLDGALARRRCLETPLGALLDPIADKALIGVALVGLSWSGELWWWVTIVILVREVAITA
jgi:CDP-diacylglycerol--glycerol-3-phosphate 3-phosphatidyltransferase